jgi:predicted RNA-binding Zn-ribbon protein involved in translation (DUF1610 family)
MRKVYQDDRLYCSRCRTQPDFFEEITNWKMSHVTPWGEPIIEKGHGEVEYQCPTCGGEAEWGSEFNRER